MTAGPPAITLDELLARHVEARGGAGLLAAVATVRMSGKATGGEIKGARMTVEKKRPNLYLRRLDDRGEIGVQAVDGDLVWEAGKNIGTVKPRAMPRPAARRFKRASDIDGALVDPVAKGHKLTLVGMESLGERTVYKVNAVWSDGDRGAYYLDATDFLLAKAVEPTADPNGAVLPAETVYRDYREVGGVLWPFAETMTIRDTGFVLKMAWDTVEVNAELADASFQMPRG